jgi:beta-galactosidase
MSQRYPPISPKIPRMLHGADYNPDQWQRYPEVLAEDIRLMKLAKCNAMSVGIFAWSALEPAEGVFTFEWLDRVLDRFAENGIYALLATPSGARPVWMSVKYPEVLRVGSDRVRNLHGQRHNHCYTSPVYREKTAENATASTASRHSACGCAKNMARSTS